jgi:hypothetical protein
VFLARDKFKMNVLESSVDKFSSIRGIGVQTEVRTKSRPIGYAGYCG